MFSAGIGLGFTIPLLRNQNEAAMIAFFDYIVFLLLFPKYQAFPHARRPFSSLSTFLPTYASVKTDGCPTNADFLDVIIVGGGLTGMGAGVALHNRGVTSVAIYEKASKLQKIGAAIGLYPNGLEALGYIDHKILDKIRQTASPCQTFERRDLQNQLVQITDVPTIKATAPVMYAWYLLQQKFVEALPESCIHLGHTLTSYHVLENGLVQATFEKTHDKAVQITKTCRILIGADGIHSRVREQMKGCKPTLKYYGKVMYRSVVDRKEIEKLLDLPGGNQISWQGTTKGQSFSLRETTADIVTVTAAAVVDDNHPTAGDDKRKKDRLQNLFSSFPDVVRSVIGRLKNNAIHEDYIRDVSIPSTWSEGPVVLVGDAVHAMTPHMGQGANIGLEDVCELVHRLLPHLEQRDRSSASTINTTGRQDLEEALTSYCQSRLERVTEVQEQSRQNTLQSNTYDKATASIPFERRKYSDSFKDRLYKWKAPE